ncbi:MAG: hypothetical protein P8X77_16425 [Maritimibacter sp.]
MIVLIANAHHFHNAIDVFGTLLIGITPSNSEVVPKTSFSRYCPMTLRSGTVNQNSLSKGLKDRLDLQTNCQMMVNKPIKQQPILSATFIAEYPGHIFSSQFSYRTGKTQSNELRKTFFFQKTTTAQSLISTKTWWS